MPSDPGAGANIKMSHSHYIGSGFMFRFIYHKKPKEQTCGIFFPFYNTDAVLKAFPATSERTLVSFCIFKSFKIFSSQPQVI